MSFRILSSGFIKCSWSRGGRAIALLAAGLTAACLAGQAVRVALAQRLGESLVPDKVQAAVLLDPANPELHLRLGQVYLYVLDDLDAAEALKCFRRATELNPHLASLWAALGSACDVVRDTVCADRAFGAALSLNPMTADLFWVVGNHYLLTNRPDQALAYFHRLLELSPRYASETFAVCLKLLDDPQIVFQRVLPETEKGPELRLAFITFLSAHGRLDDAYQVWVQTAAKTSLCDFSLVRPYLDNLLDLGRYEEATNVWRDLERQAVIRRPRNEQSDNLIYNGDFEQTPLNSGLDWHWKKQRYVALDFSDLGAFQGARCLRVDFTVNRNEEYEPVYQIVPVVPQQPYLLSAYVRSEDITSDSGPCLRLLDPACPACLDVSTEMALATKGWHRVSLQFTTGTRTRFVRLSVWRQRSRTFPAEIHGRYWLDAVCLRALGSVGTESAKD